MIRVFVADDHALVREGLKRVISQHRDLQVVGEAGCGDQVLAAFETARWDVLVLDVGLPAPSGAEVLRILRAQDSRLGILMLSMHEEDGYALRLLQAGADGYLSKSRSPEEIIVAIRAVATEGKYLTPRLATLLLEGDHGPAATLAVLSDRELEILRLIVRGRSPSLVAADLGLAPSTVSTHLARIKSKLALHSTAELVELALRTGLLERTPG